MKKIFASAVLALFFSISAFAQATCTRHVEAAGRFSYCPPAGWVVRDPASGTPYKSFFTPDNATVRANFNVRDEATKMTNDEYMASALKYMLQDNEARGIEMRKVIGWTPFTTASKISGSRMVYETNYKGLNLRTVQFIFDFPGRKVLLTGTSLVMNKGTTDPIFDAVAKTLKLNP